MVELRNRETIEGLIDAVKQPEASRPQLFRALQSGISEYRVCPLDDIQKAINACGKSGGGRIILRKGIHHVTSPLYGISNLEIVGENSADTTIRYVNAGTNLSFAGTDAYSTGTITSITGGVNVTGSGTSWLTNVTTDHQLLIGQRWYKIAAVTGNTSMVLGEGFAGLGVLTSFPGVSYRAVKVIQGVEIKEVTVDDSTVTGITFDDCRDVVLEDIIVTDCNKGIVFTNSAQLAGLRVITPANTSNGVEFQACGFGDLDGISSAGNGGHGMVINSSRVLPFSTCSMSANTSDGINITSSESIVLNVELASNGGQGAEVVSGSHNVIFQNSLVDSNTSDGIKLTASADSCKISGSEITSNGGYGVNIAASTCDNTIIEGSVFSSNTTDEIIDSGVGSIYSGNKGIVDKNTEQAKNVSGSSVALGDVVTIGSSSTEDTFSPDASQEDGIVIRSGVDETFSTILAGAGTASNDSDADAVMRIEATATTDQYSNMRHMIIMFDTSSIPSGNTITSATVELYVNANTDGGLDPNLYITSSDPASDNALVNSDYDTVGTTEYSDLIASPDISATATETWTLNSTGIAAISKTGTTKFAVAFKEPTWSNSNNRQVEFSTNEGANDPLLRVNHKTGTEGDEITTTTTGGDDKVFGIAEETIADSATGSIQTLGKTVSLKVDGTTDIAVGDLLATFTTAKIAQKATSGDMAFAIALEAYATDDSSGVIDARLITPRKL